MVPSVTYGVFKYLIFVLLSTSLLVGCKKDEYTPIMGKWKTNEMGNWPDMQPIKDVGYREYLSDSILREYNYNSKTFFFKKYWIDSLLHEGVKAENGSLIITRFTYKFYGEKLRLDFYNTTATL